MQDINSFGAQSVTTSSVKNGIRKVAGHSQMSSVLDSKHAAWLSMMLSNVPSCVRIPWPLIIT